MKKRAKEALLFFLTAAAVAALMLLFRIPCPIKHLTGISCPGCGMSRALLALMRLEPAAALRFHPLVFALPFFCLGLFFSYVTERRRLFYILLTSAGIVMLALWLVRIIWFPSEAVSFSPAEGLIGRMFRLIAGIT